MGTGGEAECRRKPGTLWAALLFGSTTRTDVPQPRPQHQAYAVWFPALRGPPPQSLLPSHLRRVGERARASAPKPAPARTATPRPAAPGSGCGWGAPRTSAGGGRGRPERDRLWSARRARLAAGGAPRGWRPQDQKSDSGSGQMSCCLSTARAAAQHSPL